jgi:hypothetical protein
MKGITMSDHEPTMFEFFIAALLSANPGTAYITPSGDRIYLLNEAGELVYLIGVNLNKLDADGIDQFIQDTIILSQMPDLN